MRSPSSIAERLTLLRTVRTVTALPLLLLLLLLLLSCSCAHAMMEEQPAMIDAMMMATDTPTAAPHDSGNTTTAPTKAPTTNTTHAPTMAPHSSNATAAPTKVVTKAPTPSNNTKTSAPNTGAPTSTTPSKSPVKPPPHDDKKNDNDTKQHGSFSIWRMLGKTLAFLILLFLSVLAFGAIMNHRYRIYYFLRGLWYTIIGLECTQWILGKLGLRHRVDTSAMNTMIFDDNEMSYGLLMQENE
jgi:energy-converting hydrogenase Eha subunit F